MYAQGQNLISGGEDGMVNILNDNNTDINNNRTFWTYKNIQTRSESVDEQWEHISIFITAQKLDKRLSLYLKF